MVVGFLPQSLSFNSFFPKRYHPLITNLVCDKLATFQGSSLVIYVTDVQRKNYMRSDKSEKTS